MPIKDREVYNRYMRKYMRPYRKRQKQKITELKQLALQPLTVTTSLELIEKIKEL